MVVSRDGLLCKCSILVEGLSWRPLLKGSGGHRLLSLNHWKHICLTMIVTIKLDRFAICRYLQGPDSVGFNKVGAPLLATRENVAEPDTMLMLTSNEDCEQTQGIQQKKQRLFVGDVELTLRGYRNFFSNEPPPCRFSAATPSSVCRRQLA